MSGGTADVQKSVDERIVRASRLFREGLQPLESVYRELESQVATNTAPDEGGPEVDADASAEAAGL